MDPATLDLFISNELARPRYDDPRCLQRAGRKVFSQNDEDGIIAEIFRRIGDGGKTFVEFGLQTGVECNTAWLLMQGWKGLWIEANAAYIASMRASHRAFIADGRLNLLELFVTKDNIDAAIVGGLGARECDLLSIDIDFNDYWVWSAIVSVKPRVVVIEYNASWPPPAAITVPYDAAAQWNNTSYFGASLGALAKLGDAKGYHLVACSLAGVNAFFVRKDLCGDLFFEPGSAEAHYQPPRYYLCAIPSGHPPGLGEIVQV